MKKTTLLVIEGRHAEIPSFANDLQKKGFDIRSFQNGGQAAAKVKQINPAMVVINAASIRKKYPKLPIILILEKEKPVDKELADSVLALPFTVQKLVNRVKALMPGD